MSVLWGGIARVCLELRVLRDSRAFVGLTSHEADLARRHRHRFMHVSAHASCVLRVWGFMEVGTSWLASDFWGSLSICVDCGQNMRQGSPLPCHQHN